MKIIGRAEQVGFPQLGISALKAKVDTGADTSSLHATRIKLVEHEGVTQLKCHLAGSGPFYFKDYQQRKVKSSNGSTQQRFVIKTLMQLGGKRYRTFFTLTNRSKMRYPVLLGKRFLRGKFLVDVSLKNRLKKEAE